MSYSLTFSRHFARLVWLQLRQTSSSEAQIATLKALVAASAEGAVTVSTQDWYLLVNGAALPERFTGVQELAAQFIGHSVAELTVEQNASPTDLLVLARILSSEPEATVGGRTVLERLEALGATTVSVRLEQARELAAVRAEGRPEQHAGSSARDEGPDDLIDEQDPEQMYRVFTAVVETPKGSMMKLLDQLDASSSDAEMVRHLDALVKMAGESATVGRNDIVADVFHGLVEREGAVKDRPKRRVIGMAIRRLSKRQVLQCITALLPRRHESYEQYMTVLRRVEDDGVEALVDALVSAPSIADRRVYFDALLTLRTGVRTLLHTLGDERWYVVRNAVELLGELRMTEAAGEITKLLEHADDRVRTAASAALAKFGTVEGAKGVRVALRDAQSADVREQAAEALASTPDPGSIDMLFKALDREEDPRVHMAILTALGQIGTAEAVEKLVEVARGEGGIFRRRGTQLRVAAVKALAEVDADKAASTLQELQRDKHKEVRGAASWVLMGQKGPKRSARKK